MKTYRRKFVNRALKKSNERNMETRDAILWLVDETNRKCRVKIQGSNTLIVAHYPRNLKDIPEWLRIGSAIRITHRSGERGYIEVVGPGRAIPTPVAGDTTPDPGVTGGGIVSGMVVTEAGTPSYYVNISSGTYVINGTLYTFDGTAGNYILMNDPAPMTMGDRSEQGLYTLMGQVLYYVADKPSSILGNTAYRYDAIVVGTDGVLETVQGTAVTSNPQKPDIPSNHALVAYILRTSGAGGTITNERIGETWRSPYPVSMTVVNATSLQTGSLTCGGSPQEDSIYQTQMSITIQDNYGDNLTSKNPNKYVLKANVYGNEKGTLTSGHTSASGINFNPGTHGPFETEYVIPNNNQIGKFTWIGKPDVTTMFQLLYQEHDVYGQTYIDNDYDWTYPYDDDGNCI